MAEYAQGQYGDLLYGSGLIGPAPEEKPKGNQYYRDLEKYLPEFITRYREMDGALKAQGYEIGNIWHSLDDYFSQSFVGSATWGLPRWEKVLGITANEQMSVEGRRQQIKARLIAASVCTPERIQALAVSVTGTESIIMEDSEHYAFTVYFIGKYGVPNNIRILKDAVERMKPAHLRCLYKYRYVIWNELEGKAWEEFRSFTWDALRVNQQLPFVSWGGLEKAGFTCKSIKKYTWNSIRNVEEAKA